MCNNPLYRINVYHCQRGFPKCFEKRVRNGALILCWEDKEFMRQTFGYPDNLFVPIPCGKCAGCRADYAKQWSSRLMLEAHYYTEKCFLTLTYDEENVPFDDVLNEYTGEIIRSRVLKKRDLQLFMKRLRKKLDKIGVKVRYFACGEYGSRTFRPHFHMILLGYNFPDKQFFYCQKDKKKYRYPVPGGETYYISKELSDIWQNGHCLISDVTTYSCRYVTNYCTKKLSKPKTERDRDRFRQRWISFNSSSPFCTDELRQLGAIQNEFATMSRRPGIGKRFFNDHVDEIIATDTVPYPFPSKGLSRRLRIFDKWIESKIRPSAFIDDDAPYRFADWVRERLVHFKEVRKMRAQAFDKMFRTSLSPRELRLQSEARLQILFERSRNNRDL